MTDEERQRTMNFILEQMAQVAASAQRNEEERKNREKADTRRDVSIAQLRRLLARTIWERRRDRRDWNERMAALANAQLRSDQAHARLEESMSALVDAQIRSEDAQAKSEEAQVRLAEAQARTDEKQSRTDEWQARMEESFARSDARMTRVEEEAERSSAAIAKLAVSTDRTREDIEALLVSTARNSKAIERLTDIVASPGWPRDGGEESA